jgi:hypothetical protein
LDYRGIKIGLGLGILGIKIGLLIGGLKNKRKCWIKFRIFRIKNDLNFSRKIKLCFGSRNELFGSLEYFLDRKK